MKKKNEKFFQETPEAKSNAAMRIEEAMARLR